MAGGLRGPLPRPPRLIARKPHGQFEPVAALEAETGRFADVHVNVPPAGGHGIIMSAP